MTEQERIELNNLCEANKNVSPRLMIEIGYLAGISKVEAWETAFDGCNKERIEYRDKMDSCYAEYQSLLKAYNGTSQASTIKQLEAELAKARKDAGDLFQLCGKRDDQIKQLEEQVREKDKEIEKLHKMGIRDNQVNFKLESQLTRATEVMKMMRDALKHYDTGEDSAITKALAAHDELLKN